MMIKMEETPNPDTLKFIPNDPVTDGEIEEFKDRKDTARSPLAKRLFDIPGVGSVFLAPDFISVTKTDEGDWRQLSTHIIDSIRDHYLSGLPVLNPSKETGQTDNSDDDELIIQIKALLEERVRPAVAADGGDINFVSFEEGIVYLQMRGACSGCPSATVTLKSGIENMLKHFIPEIIAVEAVPE
jgi:Fe-S cluster biogenesis protein NfuA